MKLNEKIIKLRKENNLSQEEFGNKINVSRQAISKWENGESNPEIDKIREISKIFNVSYEYLLNDEIDTLETKKEEKIFHDDGNCEEKHKDKFIKRILKSKIFKVIFIMFLLYLILSLYKLVVILRIYFIANSFSEENYSMYTSMDVNNVQSNKVKLYQECCKIRDEKIIKSYLYGQDFENRLSDENGNEIPNAITYTNYSENILYQLSYNSTEKKYEYVDQRKDIPDDEFENSKAINDIREYTLNSFSSPSLICYYAFSPFVYYVSPFTRTIISYSPSEMTTTKVKFNNDYLIENVISTSKDGTIVYINLSYDYVPEHFKDRAIEQPLEKYKDLIIFE